MNNPQPLPPETPPPQAAVSVEQAVAPAPSLESLPPAQAMEMLLADPVGFVRQIVDSAAKIHLSDLKEEAELRGVLNAFRKSNPDYARFEPFILQEVVALLETDPDSATAPWEKLLEKATGNFKEKFAKTLEEEKARKETTMNQPDPLPHVEGAANRTPQAVPASFTREQIARMSMADFLANEAAINEALKHNRIR